MTREREAREPVEAPGCVVFHCAGGKDRTGLLALVLLTLAGATPEEIIEDYLLTYDRMKQRYDELGFRDQLAALNELLASRNTTIEASLTSTIAALTMPSRYRSTHVTAISRDQNPHDPMIGGRPPAAPTDFPHKKEQQQRGHPRPRAGPTSSRTTGDRKPA